MISRKMFSECVEQIVSVQPSLREDVTFMTRLRTQLYEFNPQVCLERLPIKEYKTASTINLVYDKPRNMWFNISMPSADEVMLNISIGGGPPVKSRHVEENRKNETKVQAISDSSVRVKASNKRVKQAQAISDSKVQKNVVYARARGRPRKDVMVENKEIESLTQESTISPNVTSTTDGFEIFNLINYINNEDQPVNWEEGILDAVTSPQHELESLGLDTNAMLEPNILEPVISAGMEWLDDEQLDGKLPHAEPTESLLETVSNEVLKAVNPVDVEDFDGEDSEFKYGAISLDSPLTEELVNSFLITEMPNQLCIHNQAMMDITETVAVDPRSEYQNERYFSPLILFEMTTDIVPVLTGLSLVELLAAYNSIYNRRPMFMKYFTVFADLFGHSQDLLLTMVQDSQRYGDYFVHLEKVFYCLVRTCHLTRFDACRAIMECARNRTPENIYSLVRLMLAANWTKFLPELWELTQYDFQFSCDILEEMLLELDRCAGNDAKIFFMSILRKETEVSEIQKLSDESKELISVLFEGA